MIKKTPFISDFVANQYPIEKFRKLICLTIDIVENYLLSLEEGFDYNSSTISSYEPKYSAYISFGNSKIDSMLISNMLEEEQRFKFLGIYYNAYETLNDDEKAIFNATFIDGLNDYEIIKKYNTYSRRIIYIRKSAIIKFCLRSGLDKFTDIV